MTRDEALLVAKAYAGQLVDVEVVSESAGLYRFDPEKEYLFRVVDQLQSHVGRSRYVAVSKSDGMARDAGCAGE
jgi:hypothetical protein